MTTATTIIGANLETALLNHPLVALPIQIAGLPGKRGKPRKKLGIFERGVEPDMAVTFPVTSPSISVDTNGDRLATFDLWLTPSSVAEMDRVRRALYHIAFNLWVLNRGVESAFDERFNALRHYVRRPKAKERWSFIQLLQQIEYFQHGVGARYVPFNGAELLRIRIFSAEFWVDLLNTEVFRKARVTSDGSGKGHGLIVGPDWKPEPRKQDPPGVFHRVSIGY